MSTEYFTCDQRSEEWYKLRLGLTTGSAANNILTPGLRRTHTGRLLSELLTRQVQHLEVTAPMQWGIDNEEAATARYMQETGNKVEHIGFARMRGSFRVGCSPDGLVGSDGMIEIKCPNTSTHSLYLMDGPPKNYIMQMQFNLWVTGRAWCDFVTFDPRVVQENMQMGITRVKRDNETINKLMHCVKSVNADITELLKKHGALHLLEYEA